MILFFSKTCVYDVSKNETLIYGQYKHNLTRVILNLPHKLVICKNRPDFLVAIQGRPITIPTISFQQEKQSLITLTDIQCEYPFDQVNLGSTIISTMCRQYSHRLEEWIQYNLKLGFTGILIFNNDGNTSNEMNEANITSRSMEEICQKWPDKVKLIDFPYTQISENHWTSIQRASLEIGVSAFRSSATSIALIDADEFIYLPQNPALSIADFLKAQAKTITMQSNVLTNKGNNDQLDNNILDLATYVGPNKYTKSVLHTPALTPYEFIVNPHAHPNEIILSKEDIIHYHCWMNERWPYDSEMANFTGLRDFFHSTDKSAE